MVCCVVLMRVLKAHVFENPISVHLMDKCRVNISSTTERCSACGMHDYTAPKKHYILVRTLLVLGNRCRDQRVNFCIRDIRLNRQFSPILSCAIASRWVLVFGFLRVCSLQCLSTDCSCCSCWIELKLFLTVRKLLTRWVGQVVDGVTTMKWKRAAHQNLATK